MTISLLVILTDSQGTCSVIISVVTGLITEALSLTVPHLYHCTASGTYLKTNWNSRIA